MVERVVLPGNGRRGKQDFLTGLVLRDDPGGELGRGAVRRCTQRVEVLLGDHWKLLVRTARRGLHAVAVEDPVVQAATDLTRAHVSARARLHRLHSSRRRSGTPRGGIRGGYGGSFRERGIPAPFCGTRAGGLA